LKLQNVYISALYSDLVLHLLLKETVYTAKERGDGRAGCNIVLLRAEAPLKDKSRGHAAG
jgi:hypothetical protein